MRKLLIAAATLATLPVIGALAEQERRFGNRRLARSLSLTAANEELSRRLFVATAEQLRAEFDEASHITKDTLASLLRRQSERRAIDELPEGLRLVYRTSWEMKMRSLIDMAADRGAFICQSQSLNLFVQEPNFAKLTSMP